MIPHTSDTLTGRRILLGVTGGIAAYKSVELVRRLRAVGADVQVVMSQAATAFVTPLTFQAVSGAPARVALFDPAAEAGMDHIALARWPDLIVIAPATAHCLAKLAHGMADDLLSTLCLATDKPIAVAPAMNQQMWAHPATQANVQTLQARSVHIWGPGVGAQACGDMGAGRMLEPVELCDHVIAHCTTPHTLHTGALHNLHVLITAGPTREALDPVRFISNRSTGQMGFAVADAAYRAGAHVTLISGPVTLSTPPGVTRIDVESALDMYDAVVQRAATADIFIATAAVADYRAATTSTLKHKKSTDQDNWHIDLVKNPDILATVAALTEHRPFTVGFAAETHDVVHYAHEKRRRKGLDMIAANQVGIPGSGFESTQNALHVLWEGGEQVLPLVDKTLLGQQLVALMAQRIQASHHLP